MNPLISIVVPVYNAAAYLNETIQSVIAQTYTNWELLLVDDGSTDHSATICKDFAQKDERIFYFHKPNGGQASARNLGIQKSKGTWISFLDSDDLWLPEKLADQLEEMETHNPDFMYGLGYYYYPERAQKLKAYQWVSGEMTGTEFFETLYHSCAVNTNTVLVKKNLLTDLGGFDESTTLRGTEDWDLWLRIAKKVNRIYGSPKRNVYYRIHADGIHLQHARMLIGKLAIYSKYDQDTTVSNSMRKREYRYHYRELLNQLHQDGKTDLIKTHFKAFTQKDPQGLGTFLQRLCWPIFHINTFMWLSNKLIYRMAYRWERITYKPIKNGA